MAVEAIPLKTDLLGPGDDIVDVARRALDAAGITPEPTDIVAIGATPLAISQGRIVDIEDVRPGLIAGIACRFFDFDTPHAAQAAINDAGPLRFVLALLGARLLRLLGRRGDVYRPVAGMDNGPGTQNVILGPDDPTGVARGVARELGCAAAVVDAADPGRVEILGASAFLDRDLLVEALRGNDDQPTPLVLVRAG